MFLNPRHPSMVVRVEIRSDHDCMLAGCCNNFIAYVPGKARPGVTILSLPYAAVFDTP